MISLTNGYDRPPTDASERLHGIARGDYRTTDRGQIRASGDVVDCLEAALWSFWQTENFADATLLAANLADQLAGDHPAP